MLPCPTLVLYGKDEFKIFQHYIYFSSDRAAGVCVCVCVCVCVGGGGGEGVRGGKSDPLTALVSLSIQQSWH